jgi:hypothetical protein
VRSLESIDFRSMPSVLGEPHSEIKSETTFIIYPATGLPDSWKLTEIAVGGVNDSSCSMYSQVQVQTDTRRYRKSLMQNGDVLTHGDQTASSFTELSLMTERTSSLPQWQHGFPMALSLSQAALLCPFLFQQRPICVNQSTAATISSNSLQPNSIQSKPTVQ